METFSSLDWFVVAVYFVAVFALAIFAGSRGEDNSQTSSGYFLAGRNVGWFVIGASLFASNIGSEHLVGLAGTGAASGLAVGQFEVLASILLLLLGWVFVPIYIRSGVFTMPEFLERRYSAGARWYLAIISVAGYVLTKISVTIAAGGIVFESLMGISFWTGALVVGIATGIYTIFGGLRAVLYTDLLQMFVLVGGSIIVTLAGLAKIGGWEAMVQNAGADFFTLWKPISDPDFPWTGILFGAPILGVWYWCTDQFIVQRVLAGRNLDHARRGTIFGGFLKLLPLFIFVLPGVIAHSLAQNGSIELTSPDHALPTLIGTLLPAGLRGVVVAGLLAALMSSLSSVFNSCSTLITWDIYRKLAPNASEKTLVRVGQWATAGLVVLGLLWIPAMKLISGQLYQYLQSVQAYISPPIAAVFLFGVAWQRVNARGALAALWTGFAVGVARLVCEIFKDNLGPALRTFAEINFLHFALILFVLCSVVLVAASLTAPAPQPWVPADTPCKQLGSDPNWRKWDKRMTFLLLAAVGIIWVVFS
ncbi:MAG: sodium:solute symporter [Myxococcota bacterium]